MEWLRLRLDLVEFDASAFEHYLRRQQRAGISFTTMAELGDTPEQRRALYDLNRDCSADIPERGEFYTFEEYLAQRIDSEIYDPRGVIIARDGDTWVGMAATSLCPGRGGEEGYAFSEMTGVLRSHRGTGLSVALKLRCIDFARAAGMHWLLTFHHPENASAIAMNRRLGFVDDPSPRPEGPMGLMGKA